MEYGFFLLLVLYLAPLLVAVARDHPRVGAIAGINLALGWTVVGWIAALLWAWPPRLPRRSRGPKLRLVPPPGAGLQPDAPGNRAAWTIAIAILALVCLDPRWLSPGGAAAATPRWERLLRGSTPLHEWPALEAPAPMRGELGCPVRVLEDRGAWKRVWLGRTCRAGEGPSGQQQCQ